MYDMLNILVPDAGYSRITSWH